MIDELTRRKENLNQVSKKPPEVDMNRGAENGGVHGVAIPMENLYNSSRFSPYYSNSSISFPHNNDSSTYHPEYGGKLHVYQPYQNPYSSSPSASSWYPNSCYSVSEPNPYQYSCYSNPNPSYQRSYYSALVSNPCYQSHQNLPYTSPYISPYSWHIPRLDSVLPQIQPPICHPLDFEKNEIDNLVDGDQLLASTGNKENSGLNEKYDGITDCMDNLGVLDCMNNEMAQDFYVDHQCVGEVNEEHNRAQTRTLQSKVEVPSGDRERPTRTSTGNRAPLPGVRIPQAPVLPNTPILPIPATPTTLKDYQLLGKVSQVAFPKFNGENFRSWYFKCQQFFRVDQAPEELKIELASMRFADKALEWYQGFVEEGGLEGLTWSEYLIRILERFQGGVLSRQ
ncbi:Retrotransposon gag protein [Quillaja saponaria]|uniref:Retrotransposon gag protein n=1 Tax=Quillaja saponaria TaxID=32244 RepID=A0AAD7VJR3_QUISA|nr:Retrotransposon gag protein [Quillaja saponaria]